MGHHDGTAMTAADTPAAGHISQDLHPRHEPAEVPALSIDGVSHSYGTRRALVDINFTVAPAGFTLAVRVTAWPGVDEVDGTDSVVVVVCLLTVSVTGLDVLAPFLESPL